MRVIARRRRAAVPERPEDTSARVKAALAKLTPKGFTLLGYAESDSGGDSYQIRMGANHAVFCTCKAWQYSKTGTCKHLERFKEQVKPAWVKK